jgi:flagellar M-ring protein FliF
VAFLDLAGDLPRRVLERLPPILTGNRRTLAIAAAALVAAIVVVAVLHGSGSGYSVLFAGLSGEDGGRTIAELQKLDIPYRITEGGRVIEVPEADLGFARLQLAARGIPKQDGDHWALLDNEGLATSPFVEEVHYTRAVEAALAHTVRDIDGVVSASVKLALPKDTDFLADAPKPSAAVMIRLRPGVELTTAQTDGVVGLVAAGVPGLARENVTLVDQTGRVLNVNPKDGLQQVPQQLEIARAVGRRYEAAVEDLLIPLLGHGNFRVSADADIDFSQRQESSLRYGDSHVLSRDEAVHANQPLEPAIGIPGALSNRPPATPAVPAPAAPAQPPAAAVPGQPPAAAAAESSEPGKPEAPPPPDTHRITNFDIDRTVEALTHPSWTLRRLSVDVLINNPSRNPIPAERIRSITRLVTSAIGTAENRHVTVVDLPFADQASYAAAEVNPPWWRQAWMSAIEQDAVLVAAGLLLLFGGILPLLRRSGLGLAAIGAAGAEVAADMPDAAIEMTTPAPARLRQVIDYETVRRLAANDPVRTAQVIKEWIARDTGGTRRAG